MSILLGVGLGIGYPAGSGSVNPPDPEPATDPPSAFTATPDGADVDLAATAPDAVQHEAIHFWRADESQAFGASTDLGALPGPPNTQQIDTDVAPGDGSWQYWATAENISSIHSSPTSPALIRLGLESETEDFLDAISAKIGNAKVLAVDALIAGLKTDSNFAQLRGLIIPCLSTQQAGLINVINPAEVFTASGGLTFHANGGFESDGATGFIDTGILANAAGVFSTNSLSAGGAFHGTTGNGTAATAIFGCSSSSLFLSARSGGSMVSRANATLTLTSTLPAATAIGHSTMVRTGASARAQFKDGSSIGSDTQAASTLTAINLWFLRNNSGFAAAGQVLDIGYFGSGAINVANLHSRVATFRTAMGL